MQGARVQLYGPALSTPRDATSNDKGIFLFEGLGFGRFVLRASTGQRVSAPQAVVIDAETGWLPPVKLTLRPGAMLTGPGGGRHRAAAGPGRRGAGGGPHRRCAQRTVKTDKDGRFTVGPLVPARYQVWARLTGHAMTAPVEVQLRADKTAPRSQIRLPRAVQVLGQAVDETGAAGRRRGGERRACSTWGPRIWRC